MSEPGKAVFLSYASQDVEAALRICSALRASGIEVWFDQNELVGGDVWDAKIRRQIQECELFVPIISANTEARLEGYFRLEWKLAAQRTHTMADERAFLLPVVIDDTRDATAKVPAEFKSVQWTRIGSADSPGAFGERVKALLAGEAAPVSDRRAPTRETVSAGRRPAPLRWVVAGLVGAGALLLWAPWRGAVRPAPAASTAKADAAWPRNETVRRAYDLFVATNSTPADFTLAETILKAELAVHPGDAETLIVFAQLNNAFLSRGFDGSEARFVLARQTAEQALRVAPDDPEALFALGRYLQFRDADHARAETLLQRAVGLKPTNPNIHGALVNAMLSRDQSAGLAEAARMAARFPTHSVTQFRVAIHYADAGQLEESDRALDRALALELTSNSVVMKALRRLMVHGDVTGMGEWLDRTPAQFRGEDRVVTARFVHGLVSGRPEAALAALNAQPSDWAQDFLYTGPRSLQRGLLLQLQGSPGAARVQFEAARGALAAAREKARTDSNLINLEAWTLWYLGRTDEARAAARPLRERVTRPFRLPLENHQWWWSPLAQVLIFGERELALELIREAAVEPMARARLRTVFEIDPRLAALRNDAEIQALIAEPAAAARTAGRRAEDGGQRSALNSGKAPAARGLREAPDFVNAKSVAVLAFRALGADPENEFLSEAISDELCSVLGRVPGLKVAASASAFSFKSRRATPAEMGAQLGVAYLVAGTVQKVGNRVRVRAQLIKAADGFVVWNSETLEHEVKDMFAVQDEVVGSVAKNLQVQLGAAAGPAVAINPEAYRLYYEGRRAWGLRGEREYAAKAVELFGQAVAADPRLGRAYAGLAEARANLGTAVSRRLPFAARDGAEARELLKLAEEGVRLEPELAEAHTALGNVFWSLWRFADAERALRTAIRLNPSYAEAHLTLGRVLQADGRFDDALREMELAAGLDPLTSRIFDNYAGFLREAGRFEESLAQAERALALQPGSVQALRFKMMALSELHRHDEAVAIARGPAMKSQPGASMTLALAGLKEEAAQVSAATAAESSSGPYVLALAAQSRFEEAIAALNPSQMIVPGIGYFYYYPVWDPVRNDPRFVKFLTELGVKEAHDRAQAWRMANRTTEGGGQTADGK